MSSCIFCKLNVKSFFFVLVFRLFVSLLRTLFKLRFYVLISLEVWCWIIWFPQNCL